MSRDLLDSDILDGRSLRIGPSTENMVEPEQFVNPREEERRQANALARRLIVAFVLMVALSVGMIVLVGELNVRVPPMMFLLAFLAIAAGTITTVMTGRDKGAKNAGANDESCGCADGNPVCCSGPRPLRAFRDK